MKKNVIFTILLLLFVGIGSDVNAQTAKKKKTKTKTSKAAKDKAAADAKAADDAAAAAKAANPADKPVVADIPVPGDAIDTTSIATPDLVAESDSFNYSIVTLDTSKPLDGYINLSTLKGAKPFPLVKQDKNSVKPYKRIWRDINTADSVNKIFVIPNESLFSFLLAGIKNGKVIAYEDEAFKKKMSYKKILAMFNSDSDIIQVPDPNAPGEFVTKTVPRPFNPDSITIFQIKEDIFFDKVRGRVETYIVGLSPLRRITSKSSGMDFGTQHTFYLNFPAIRNLLAAKEVQDPQRDIYNISFDDVFLQRAFKSQIVKESNPTDSWIREKYPDAARQKKESDRIEREIARYKRNLWKY